MKNESGRLRALILDDDKSFLHMLKRMLEKRGFDAEALSDPDKAAAMILLRPFHLVFVDCVLRASHGADFIRKIRSYVGSSVDAVMVSGVVNKQSVSALLEKEPGLVFLSKPVLASDIDEVVAEVRERRARGGGKNSLLLQLFGSRLNLRQLKALIALKKAKPADLLLIIAGLLNSKESAFVKFSADGQTSCAVFLRKGEITDYEISRAGARLLGALAAQNIISPSEVRRFEGKSLNQILIDLTKECAISPYQESELKRGFLFEALKAIQAKAEVSLNIRLFASLEKKRFQIDQSGFSETAFQILKTLPSERLAAMFGPEIMEKSLAFADPGRQRFPEAEELASDLKKGASLEEARQRRGGGPDFYPRLLYILCRGGFAFDGGAADFSYMTERYRHLSRFLKTADSEEIFSAISGLAGGGVRIKDSSSVKKLYNLFVKNNHPDLFPSEIPNDLKKLVNTAHYHIKQHYLFFASAADGSDSPKKKEERIQREIEVEKLKRACKFFLEQGRRHEAASCFHSLPAEILEESAVFQMLYLWLCFVSPELGDQKKKKYYLKKVNEQGITLKRNSLYHYICGLYYEERGLAKQAERSFRKAEMIDPAFLSASAAVRKYKLKEIQRKKSGSLLNQLSNIKRKSG